MSYRNVMGCCHQLHPGYRLLHIWTENNLLVWGRSGPIRQAIADYRPDEIRPIIWYQLVATKVFTPKFRILAEADR